MSSAPSGDEDRLLRLWGKLGPDDHFHPAVFHMLDVGQVARALLGADAPPRFRTTLARALSVPDPDSLLTSLPLLVALHDIGKVSAPFQGQESQPQTRIARARLAADGFSFGQTHGKRYPHQQISAVFARDTWPAMEPTVQPPLVRTLGDALGGHHGRFAPEGDLRAIREYLDFDEPDEWNRYRRHAYRMLRQALAPGESMEMAGPEHRSRSAMALTGFIILCDWIGSDTTHFPLERPRSLANYLGLSEQRARRAVEEVGLLPARPSIRDTAFASLFPAISHPRPLQALIDEMPAAVITWPSLHIIEAPTGDGKTEAALALAQRLAAVGPSDELFFALPTTATSNQMFGRVQQFLATARSTPTPVKLIHGQAFLVEDDLRLHPAFDVDRTQMLAELEWFAPKKRALLAPFGVGTVDQAELTCLSARHYMLRLFGLAGKVVIVDEIHAYDTYMSTIVEHVLAWLAALGSSVILLSATLPAARHRALAGAFLRGAGAETAPDRDEPLPYPCLASYTPAHCLVLHPAAAQPATRLRIEIEHDRTPEQQARRLLDLVRDGGAVCHIANTVREAQDLFRCMGDLAPSDVSRYLLHSRFPVADRQARETDITQRFGPGSERSPHERAVVIGTQVLEQSLDLDFDAMVTDFAPTDLLLQRAGRLQRHDRPRVAAHTTRTLHVHLPKKDGGPDFGAWKWVYDEYILWLTLGALEQRRSPGGTLDLTLPADYRLLIEATYPSPDRAVPDGWPYGESLRASYRAYLQQRAKERGEARLRLIPEPSPTVGVTDGASLEFVEDPDGGQGGWEVAQTRFGAESLTLVPMYRQDGDLALDPAGQYPLGPSLDRPAQLRLLRRSIPLALTPTHQEIAQVLRAQRDSAPRWFREAPLLRFTVPLILDGTDAHLGATTVTLDDRLGLVLGKEHTWSD